jgi:hypothetical protein
MINKQEKLVKIVVIDQKKFVKTYLPLHPLRHLHLPRLHLRLFNKKKRIRNKQPKFAILIVIGLKNWIVAS